MRLYLIRHGAADWTSPDFDRNLSPQGRSESAKLFEKHEADWHTITNVFVSPYPRAQQSFELLNEYLPSNCSVETSGLLQPESNIADLLNWLNQHSFDSHSHIALVAHNPLLSKQLNKLLGKLHGFYQLGTSAIAALELDVFAAGCADLLWVEPGF